MQPVDPFINKIIPTNAHKVILSFLDLKDLVQRIFPLCRSASPWNLLKLENSKIVVLNEPPATSLVVDWRNLSSHKKGEWALCPVFFHTRNFELHSFTQNFEPSKVVLDENDHVRAGVCNGFSKCLSDIRIAEQFEPSIDKALFDIDEIQVEERSKEQGQQEGDKKVDCERRVVPHLYTKASSQAVVWQKVNGVWKQKWTLPTSNHWFCRVKTILVRRPNSGQEFCFYDITNNFQQIPLDPLTNLSGEFADVRHHLLFFLKRGNNVTVLHPNEKNGKVVISEKWKWVTDDTISTVDASHRLVLVKTFTDSQYLLDADSGKPLYRFNPGFQKTALKGDVLFQTHKVGFNDWRLHCVNPFTKFRATLKLPGNSVMAIMQRMYPWTVTPAERQLLIFQRGLKAGTKELLKFQPFEDQGDFL